MLPIYIPSRGRASNVRTLESLNSEMRAATSIVTTAEEANEYSRRNPGIKVIARPDHVKNVAQSRQFILETAGEPFIMLDDDLRFFVRADPSAHNLVQAHDAKLQSIWNRMESLIGQGWDLVGLSPRQMNNTKFPNRHELVTRQNAVHCISPEIFLEKNIRFDTVPVMEDYYFILCAFEEGIPNIAIVDAAWDQCGASGAPGGTSTYRTAEIQDQTAQDLAGMFPEVVKAIIKNTKGGLFSGQEVHDVRIQWRKQWKINNDWFPTYEE